MNKKTWGYFRWVIFFSVIVVFAVGLRVMVNNHTTATYENPVPEIEDDAMYHLTVSGNQFFTLYRDAADILHDTAPTVLELESGNYEIVSYCDGNHWSFNFRLDGDMEVTICNN